MVDREFTLEDLRRILRQAAGEVDGLNGDILDVEFEQLGYDSLAMLETIGVVERWLGAGLDESVLAEARTPRAVITLVNAQRTAAGAA